jgi:hypothetical protein
VKEKGAKYIKGKSKRGGRGEQRMNSFTAGGIIREYN